MFSLRSDLKIYTCDKYLLVQKVIKNASLSSEHYTFKVMARVQPADENARDYHRRVETIQFAPEGFNAKDFKEVLDLANIQSHELESLGSFCHWAKANPSKTWMDFQGGTSANLSLRAVKLDEAFKKIRPDVLMNTLALSQDSKIAQLIGKARQGYRRRRGKEDRQTQLIRLWSLFGTEVALSAASKDLEAILTGIQLHDFGITHCESMQSVIDYVIHNIDCRLDSAALAASIRDLDSLIESFGGKAPVRARPRSPYFREAFDILNVKAA